ncbi:hypothetical protein FS749_006546 [Ceratobasidium sp. UAMH 11750]|nr:hypothetical protein FS749_006546 [Ceratobasidium sp. UAMH 11750]
MQTFTRLFSIVTFLLSLGFIAQALPTPAAHGGALAAREYGAAAVYARSDAYGNGAPANTKNGGGDPVDVLAIVVDLKAKVDPIVAMLGAATCVDDTKVQVDALVAEVKVVIAVLPTVLIAVSAEVKAKIAAIFVEIFIAIITACAAVSVRLGVAVCLSLWAQIDVCLHALLLALNVCCGGIIAIVAKLCLELDASVCANLKLIHFDLLVVVLSLVAKVKAAVDVVVAVVL